MVLTDKLNLESFFLLAYIRDNGTIIMIIKPKIEEKYFINCWISGKKIAAITEGRTSIILKRRLNIVDFNPVYKINKC